MADRPRWIRRRLRALRCSYCPDSCCRLSRLYPGPWPLAQDFAKVARVTASRVFLAAASGLWLAGALGLPFAAAEVSREEAAVPQRFWANSRSAWLYPQPRLPPNGVGYSRAGASVALTTGEPVRGPGCARGWYAVEPHGYICD